MVILSPRFVRSFRRTTPSAPVLALTNSALLAFADILFNPFLIAVVIYFLGGETWKIALPLTMSGLAWSLSVPLRSLLARIAPPGRYLATATGVIRTGAAAYIAWLGYFAKDIPSPIRLADLLLICFGVYVAASALNLATTRGLIAASNPGVSALPLFRLQRIVTGLCAVAGAIVALYALRSPELIFYKNIGVIFLLGAVATAAATWFQFMTTVAATRAAIPVAQSRGGVVRALGNPAIRRLLGFRFLNGLSTLTDPFLLIYGFQQLNFSLFYAAAAIATYAGGQTVASLLLPAWVHRHGPRSNLLTASLLRFLGITLILTVPVFAETSLYTDRFDTSWQATLVFTGAFAFLGISAFAQATGGQRYIADVVSPADRNTSTVLTNLVLAIIACAPLLGAFLIEQYDVKTTITIALVLSFAGFAANGLLFDPSPKPVRRHGAWRHRREPRRAA